MSSRKHPFYDVIMETPLPDNWKNLTINKYDGNTIPDEHITAYTTQISLYTWNDVVMCRVFPTTLKGATLSWFTRLPSLCIDCFDTLVEKFGAQFVTSRSHHLTSIALVNIRQEKGESLRMFMEHFGKVALGIQNLSPEVTMHHMIIALKPGPFADSLCKKPATNLDELRQRTSKFMQMEELREFRNHARTNGEECIGLKDRIEKLIQAGQLRHFVRSGNTRTRQSPERGSRGGELEEMRLERFQGKDNRRIERMDRREGRPEERRNGRSYQNAQSIRRSRERSLGRPVRGFINTISGGFSGKESSSVRKQYWRSVRSVNHVFKKRTLPPMFFTDEDFQEIDPDHDDPIVITIEIAEYVVMKTLVDQGSSVDILFWDTFRKLHLKEEDIVPF
ncbi:uncharacterized protein [Phaseolus vulgaris]|uniref:uncharacterized protein n=1 Tax=Phaseolus vulgaris TaxID=3885 RepID=UPI0035C9DBC0